ncbi:hypothetical protein BDB00DRAFT_588914 [Zychaea mexicana]|uniref:uncharacterized protein n=1 Tax=Zychaea mexicana TaxID=64656 RepID=UPI0022FDBCAE|nr:uncharacterized protein BDB00DRAFT_588914 [Zychaea mexicana]KAI9497738.1 hypothetical protein BDB00DRAFT_588914 [Zychaea mexicana]
MPTKIVDPSSMRFLDRLRRISGLNLFDTSIPIAAQYRDPGIEWKSDNAYTRQWTEWWNKRAQETIPTLNGSVTDGANNVTTTTTLTPASGDCEQETVAETVMTTTVDESLEETLLQEVPEQLHQIAVAVEDDRRHVNLTTEKRIQQEQEQEQQQESIPVAESDSDSAPLTEKGVPKNQEQKHQQQQQQQESTAPDLVLPSGQQGQEQHRQLTEQEQPLPPAPITTIRQPTPPPSSSLPPVSLPEMMFARPTQYEQTKCDDAVQTGTNTTNRTCSTLRNRFEELLNILNHPDSEVSEDNYGSQDPEEAVKQSGKTSLLFKLLDMIAGLQAGFDIAIITENHNTESTICQLLRSHDYRCERIPVILEDNWENDHGVFLSTDKDRTEKWSSRPTIDIVIVFDIRILPSDAIFTKIDGDKRSVWMITKGTIEERAFPILCQGAADLDTDDWKTVWKHKKLLQNTMYASNTWHDLDDTERMSRKSIARAIPSLFRSSLSSRQTKRPASLGSSLRVPKRLCTATFTTTANNIMVPSHGPSVINPKNVSTTTTLSTSTIAISNNTPPEPLLPAPKNGCATTTNTATATATATSNNEAQLEQSLPGAERVSTTTFTTSNSKTPPLPSLSPLNTTTRTTLMSGGGTQESPFILNDSTDEDSDVNILDVGDDDDENEADVLTAVQPPTPVPDTAVETNVALHQQQEERNFKQEVECQEDKNVEKKGNIAALSIVNEGTEDVVNERMSIDRDPSLNDVEDRPLDVVDEDRPLDVVNDEDRLLDVVGENTPLDVLNEDPTLDVAGKDPAVDLDIFKKRAGQLIKELLTYPKALNVERKQKEVTKAARLSRVFKENATEAEIKLYSDKIQSELESIESSFQDEYQELLDTLQNQYASYTAALQYKYREEAMIALENAVTSPGNSSKFP